MCGFICSTFCLLMVVVSFEIFLLGSAAPLYSRLPATSESNTGDGFGIGKNTWWTSMKPSSKKELISSMITSESPNHDSNDYEPQLDSLPNSYNLDKQIDDSSVVDDGANSKNSMKESSWNTFSMNNKSFQKREKENVQLQPKHIFTKNTGGLWWEKKLRSQNERSQIDWYLI